MRRLSAYGPSLIVLGTAALVLLAGPYAVRELSHAQTQARIQQASQRLNDSPILEQLNDAFRDIAAVVEPSVVHISAARRVQDQFGRDRGSLSSGSGWIWDEQGHIVTNYHVVEDARRVEVQLYDGTLRDAEVVGYDRLTDIAVIKIDPKRLIPSQRVSIDEPVDQGDLVFAFGSPFDFRFSMSQGVVSGIGRSVGVIRPTGNNSVGYENFIQVDAAINPGNSGGPLTNYRGQVIGMNTAIATRREQGSLEEGQFAGIGLAIPMSMIDPVVTQLIETGVVTKGFLGVSADPLPRDLVRELTQRGMTSRGVIVRTVDEEGPALRAGLLRDDIITAIGSTSISSMEQLRATISSKVPGDVVELHVLRLGPGGEFTELTIDVKLEVLNSIRVNGIVPDNQDKTAIPEIGIERMTDASDEIAAQFGMENTPGVVITSILDRSYLDGIIPEGTTIIAVMGDPVTNVDQFLAALRQYNLRATRVRVAAIDPTGEPLSFRLTIN